MNLNGMLSIAKLMLPKNSPWHSRLEQAMQMAGQFEHSPNGVRQLMQQMGKTQDDLKQAVDALNNPVVSGTLDKLSPGLSNQLKQAGATLTQQPLSPASPASPSGDPLAAIREKLRKL